MIVTWPTSLASLVRLWALAAIIPAGARALCPALLDDQRVKAPLFPVDYPWHAKHWRGTGVLSDALRLFYVNVPKAGSMTLRFFLMNHGGGKLRLHDDLNATQRQYRLVSFTRDPVPRFLSALRTICHRTRTPSVRRSCRLPFEEMVGKFLSMTYQNPQWDEHVIPQLRFLEFVPSWEGFPEFEIRDVAELNTFLSEYSKQPVRGRYDLENHAHPDTEGLKSDVASEMLSDEHLRGLCYLYHWDFVCLNYTKPAACSSL